MADVMEAVRTIGLDYLTLQTLAAALQVTPGALYRHFSGKDDVIFKFVAFVTEQFPIAVVPGEDWPTWARRFARALLELYRAVPGLADYSIGETQTSNAVLSRHEVSIAAAMVSGMTETQGLYATRAVVEFVAGWVAREQRRAQIARRTGVHPDATFRDFVTTDASARYPKLGAALHAEATEPNDVRFYFTLRALIDGLLGCIEG